ncbi:hypothetical protein ACS0TY_018028 [Phlomoides rotata]
MRRSFVGWAWMNSSTLFPKWASTAPVKIPPPPTPLFLCAAPSLQYPCPIDADYGIFWRQRYVGRFQEALDDAVGIDFDKWTPITIFSSLP